MEVGAVVLKALIGGALVVVFALLGEVVKPRRLAGITSAAPSIALASLAITLLVSGVTSSRNLAMGMIAGAIALVAGSVVATHTVRKYGALKGSVAATGVWCAVALALWAAILRP
jgi:uncharacterized membrane protein (GlpM family)